MTVTNDANVVSNEVLYCSEDVDVEVLENGYRVVPKSTKMFCGMVCPGGGNAGCFNLGMETGKSYTISVDITVIKLYKTPFAQDIPKIAVDITNEGKYFAGFANSMSAPNVYGTFHLKCSFTLPVNCTGARCRLHLGAIKDSGEIIFSNFKILSEIVTNKRNNIVEYDCDWYNKLKEADRLFKNKNEQESKKFFLAAIQEIENPLKLDQLDSFFSGSKGELYLRYRLYQWVYDNLDKIAKIAKASEEQRCDLGYVPVFSFWQQGLGNAPVLMSKFFDKMREYSPKNTLHILDDASIKFWVEIPDVIQKISQTRRALYADYIRVALLDRYGGLWLDSTCWVRKDFYDTLLDACTNDVFMFHYNKYSVSSWLICAKKPASRLISLIKAALLLWFENNDDINNYFMFHCIVAALLHFLPELRNDFSPMPEYLPECYDSKVKLVLPSKYKFENVKKETLQEVIKSCPVLKFSFKDHDYRKFSLDSIVSMAIRDQEPFNL